MIFVKILFIGLVVVFAGYQIYALVRDVKAKKKNPLGDKNDKDDKN